MLKAEYKLKLEKERILIKDEVERAFTLEKLKLEKELNKKGASNKKQQQQALEESSKIEILESSVPAFNSNNSNGNPVCQKGWNVINSPVHQRLSQKSYKKSIKSPLVSSPRTEDSTVSFWGPSAIFENPLKKPNNKNQRGKRKPS
jgi:hypothetical protein